MGAKDLKGEIERKREREKKSKIRGFFELRSLIGRILLVQNETDSFYVSVRVYMSMPSIRSV